MNCRELAELLIDYVSDELSPEHRRHLDQHIKLCPPCQAYLQSYSLTIKLTGQLPRNAPPPPQLMARLRTATQEFQHPPTELA